MRLRYAGEFLSLSGIIWRCEIYQEASSAFTVGELTFPIDPLSLEWDSRSPEETVCGSMATLRIESPGDRTYADLYTETPGSVRLDVYRDGNLYWSGCLDTETYTEPYDRGAFYDVELTFYDFGLLGRIPYNLTGKKTFRQILVAALSASGVNYGSINEDYISTTFTNDTAVTLAAVSIPSENFFDEDGEALDFEAVLRGILQPLALRMVQRAGVIWIYDINGLYTQKSDTVPVVWNASGQRMDTGRVYNNIRVTFSPYSSALLAKAFAYGDTFGPEYINLTSDTLTPDRYSYYVDYDEAHRHGASWDYNLIDFTIFRSRDTAKCTGLAAIGGSNYFFKIFPNLGGSEAEGVAVGFYTGGHGALTTGWPVLKGINPGGRSQTVAFRTERAFLPPLSTSDQKYNFIKIVQEMLADPRYNPFEDSPEDGDSNENANYAEFQSWANHAFVPVAIVLYNASGTALYHYTNRNITTKGHPADSVANCASTQDDGATLDGWVAGEASFGDAWFAYYDSNLDLVEGNAVFGWKANRQNFGKPWAVGNNPSKRKLYYSDADGNTQSWWSFDSFKKAPDGQFIPYPPAGGYLEIRVYNCVYIFDDTDHFAIDGSGGFADQGLYSKLRWLLFKAPEVSVVKRTLTFDDAEIDDVEYNGVCNANAKEELSIDTICGTAPSICPSARGILLRTSTGHQVQQFKRAGRTESAEQLLIGTLYSQFATRKTVLSGPADLDTGGVTLYDEAAQPSGTKFLLTGEVQHIRDEMTEIDLLEVRPDEYTAE